MAHSPWSPGTPVVIRGIAHDKVWIAHTVTVVEDQPDFVAVYLAPGAPCKFPSGLVGRKYGGTADGRSRWDEQDSTAWTLMDWRWKYRHALIQLWPDRYYALFYFWSAESGEFEGYYVNFQLPYTRTPFSIDTLDLEIDLMVWPDGSRAWKDEEAYGVGVRRGSIPAETAAAVEAARAEVIERVDHDPTFLDTSWLDWRPDAIWGIPALPPQWQEVEAPNPRIPELK